ncbi:hypothetical protein IIA15_08400, partial [candidate division TA06 bacterium]|nr:hypothetical protein [candidate division TA06 bacterium]
ALNSGEIINESYAKRESILKTSGTEIPTTLFIDNDYQRISAVMFSPHWISNNWNQNGSDIIIVHNPNATNPLPLGMFQFGVEKWVEDGELKSKDWRQSLLETRK